MQNPQGVRTCDFYGSCRRRPTFVSKAGVAVYIGSVMIKEQANCEKHPCQLDR